MNLRDVTIDDAKLLFKWKNDATTRKFAIKTHDKIDWEDHLNWLLNRLPQRNYFMIEVDDEPVGTVRFEPDEVAIIIDKRHRNKGIGRMAMEKVIRMNTTRPLRAKIVDGNLASMRLFLKLGFFPVEYKKGYFILELT